MDSQTTAQFLTERVIREGRMLLSAKLSANRALRRAGWPGHSEEDLIRQAAISMMNFVGQDPGNATAYQAMYDALTAH